MFSDVDYWQNDFGVEQVKNYWFFGANGQGDLWVLNKEGQVFFYDHDQGRLSNESLIDLEINFAQWLQFAYLNKQLEAIENKEGLTEDIKRRYIAKLAELSKGLAENYPFEIFI